MEQNIFSLSGKRLKEARKAVRPLLTQAALAEKLGVTRVTLNVWEKRDVIEIDADQMRQLVKVLKVSSDDLTYKDMDAKAPGVDLTGAINKLDGVYRELLNSKQEEILSKTKEIERLEQNSQRLWKLVDDLTKGFSTIQKTQK